jgi:Rrf2 family protein
MIYSVGCEYGIRALSILASRFSNEQYTLLRDILESDDLPHHFVGKIFQILVRADILRSSKGRGGGFALARAPSEITLRDIVDAIDGLGRLDRCVLGIADCSDEHPCPQHEDWKKIREQIRDMLNRTTLAHLAAAIDRNGNGPNGHADSAPSPSVASA